jgi:uncharacterized protein YwgA
VTRRSGWLADHAVRVTFPDDSQVGRQQPSRRSPRNSARIDLKLALDRAVVPVQLDTFSRRFNIQKRVYLIQIAGCDLSYRYGWYLRGPYSKTLTADAFTLKAELEAAEQDHARHELSAQAAGRIDKAKALWSRPDDASVGGDEWLELLASLHYLKHIAYWPREATRDLDAVFAKLVEAKPQFTNARAAAGRAWGRLDEFGLLTAKTLA